MHLPCIASRSCTATERNSPYEEASASTGPDLPRGPSEHVVALLLAAIGVCAFAAAGAAAVANTQKTAVVASQYWCDDGYGNFDPADCLLQLNLDGDPASYLDQSVRLSGGKRS